MSSDSDPMNASSAPRQTQRYVRELLNQNRLRPKNKLGQNFLVDLNLLDFVVKHAELTRADLALEVGTGTGGLTTRLAEQAGAVLSIEIDNDFHELARETVGPQDHVRLVHVDVLKNKNQINPVVLDALAEMRERYRPERLKLVANLPYAVATPVITNLLLLDLPFERMIVTVQWEIGERLASSPGNKDYGALAILVQSVADVEILRRLAPGVFWPRPKVDSAIVRISPNAEKRRQVPDLPAFRVFLRDLYAHRRKNLRGALVSMPQGHAKPWVDAKLAELGYDGTTRSEALTIAQHLELCATFAGPAQA